MDADVEAEITLVPTEQGGRRYPVSTGFRPQFHYDGQDWDAHHEYPDVQWVYPGQTARVFLQFLSPASHLNRLSVGMTFQLREGPRTIGHGRITKILNLSESAAKNPRRPELEIDF